MPNQCCFSGYFRGKFIDCFCFQTVVRLDIYHRGGNILMDKEVPDVNDVDSGFQHVHRFAVPETVCMDFRKRLILTLDFMYILLDDIVDSVTAQLRLSLADNQRLIGRNSPSLPFDVFRNQSCCITRNRYGTVFIPFAMETHCGIVPGLDIPDRHITEFLHTTPAVIKKCQDYPVTQYVFRIDIRVVDQLPDLIG